MIPENCSFARLRFAEGDIKFFCEFAEGFFGFGIFHATTKNEERFLFCLEKFDGLFDCTSSGSLAVNVMNSLLEKVFGIIVSLAFNVLRQSNANRAGVCRVGKHTHCIDTSRH